MNEFFEKKFYKNQTSFYEQAIYYYIKKLFPEAINRCLLIGSLEADIFIPSIRCAIEYDGQYWHKDKLDFDNYKNRVFNENGVTVIRVRDSGLPQLEEFDGVVYYHNQSVSDEFSFHTNEIVELIVHFLSTMVEDEEQKRILSSYKLSRNQFLFDSPDINGLLYTKPLDDSLANLPGIDAWDYEKNGSLLPTNIPANYMQRVFFKCRTGKSIFDYPDKWFAKKGWRDLEYKKYCPYLIHCGYVCEIKECFIKDFYEGIIQFVDEKERCFTIQCITKMLKDIEK